MISRRKTKTVHVGNVIIGYTAPVVIQSMTKVPTHDIPLCVDQVNQLIAAGCDLVRIAVPTKTDTEAFAKIVDKVKTPLIADIHFSPERAIEAIEGGAAKIRLNPGNIKNRDDIYRIIDAAKLHNTAIRIGVNEASIRNLKTKDISSENRVGLMLDEMRQYVSLFESKNFDQIVLSAKSTDVLRTIKINRLMAETFDYPIHLGLTHAGLIEDAQIPSAVALGALLSEGIGDTMRISIAGDPVGEIELAKSILVSLGLRDRQNPEVIVCPTCGRTQIDVVGLARKIRQAVKNNRKPIRIAVMGCFVNGPGEAADADLAICGGKDKAYLYKAGKKIDVVPEEKIVERVLLELNNF